MRISPQFKLWHVNENGEYVFGPGTMELLDEIDRRGTISGAADDRGMPFQRALKRLNLVEKRLGRPLIERTRGGRGGRWGEADRVRS